jgi:hypothetical protein
MPKRADRIKIITGYDEALCRWVAEHLKTPILPGATLGFEDYPGKHRGFDRTRKSDEQHHTHAAIANLRRIPRRVSQPGRHVR